MKTYHDLTWYHRTTVNGQEKWILTQIKGVQWEDRKASTAISRGEISSNAVTVFIPATSGPYDIQTGDILVKGLVDDEITAEKHISSLRQKYQSVAIVKNVDNRDFGSTHMRHMQIGAE